MERPQTSEVDRDFLGKNTVAMVCIFKGGFPAKEPQ